MAFCLAEDRPRAETGLRLLIASLSRHCPEVPTFLRYPCASRPFVEWLARHRQVRLDTTPLSEAYEWNCKPHALLPLLRDGWPQVVWLDSDLLLTCSPGSLLLPSGPDEIILAEEPHNQSDQGSECRTRAWGWPVGKAWPRTFNSCVIGVGQHHITLLERWREALADPEYQACARRPLRDRPRHLTSDQDVLNGLLGSREFSHLNVTALRSGRQIIHCGGALGWSLSERLHGLFHPLPVFLHAIAGKPWHLLDPGHIPDPGFFGVYRRWLQELSPYVAEARRYRGEIAEPMLWLDNCSAIGRALRVAGLGHYALRGLPLTIAATLIAATRAPDAQNC